MSWAWEHDLPHDNYNCSNPKNQVEEKAVKPLVFTFSKLASRNINLEIG